jgi:hypothetical protein
MLNAAVLRCRGTLQRLVTVAKKQTTRSDELWQKKDFSSLIQSRYYKTFWSKFTQPFWKATPFQYTSE